MLILSLRCHILLHCIWLKAGVGHSFTVICLEALPYSSAVTWCHHIEWIRGITAYSLACGESLWQVCGGACVNSNVGTSGLSNSAGMTAQVSPGTCSVRLDPQVHLETLLLLLLPDLPRDSQWHLMFHVSAQRAILRLLWLSHKSKCKLVANIGKHKVG